MCYATLWNLIFAIVDDFNGIFAYKTLEPIQNVIHDINRLS